MELILFTHPDFIAGEPEFVNELFDNGLETLHFRKPGFNKQECFYYLESISQKHRHKIMLHQEYDLAIEFGLKGIHFTEKTKSDFELHNHLNLVKSMACHNLEELKKLPDAIDYASISPVYNSISKANYESNIDKSQLAEICQLALPYKIFALGGICENNIAELKELGLDGVCILGDFWNRIQNKQDSIRHLKKLINLCR